MLRISLVLGVLLIAAVLALPYALPWLLQQQGIDAQWKDPQWHLDGFSVSQLQLTLPGDDQHARRLQFDNLRINWAWKTLPIQRLQAEHVQIHWPITRDQTSAGQTSLAVPAALLKWLPQHIELQDIDANLPGFGHLQGLLNVDVSAQGEIWQPASIQSQFTLKDLQGAWLDGIPAAFRPTQLNAQINTHQDDSSGQQLLVIEVDSDKAMQLQLKGLLDLQRTPDWHGTLNNAELNAQLDTLAYPAVRAEKLQAHAYFTAQADSEKFAVTFSDHSSLQANNVQTPDVAQVKKIIMQLAGLSVSGRSSLPHDIAINGPVDVHLENLNAAQLHTQNWDFNGNLNGQLPQLELTGTLASQKGLALNSHIRLQDNEIQGSATLNEVSFEAGNPLQKTLKNWPETISLNNGQLRGQIEFNKPDTGPLNLSFNSSASAISGSVYDSEVKNLGMELNGQLTLQQAPSLQAALKDTKFIVQLDSLKSPTVNAQQLQASARVTGHVGAERFALNVSEVASLQAHSLQLPGIGHAEKATIKLPDLSVKGSTGSSHKIDVHSALNAHVDKLSSEQLHTQNWDFKGSLGGQLSQLELAGSLTGDQGLSLASKIRLADNTLRGSATANDVFFKAGNPLQKTFKSWPELVSFDSGRLRTQVDFSLPPKGSFSLSLKGSATGLNGVINRSELKNADVNFNGQVSGQTLKLDIPNLTIGQLNPGIPLASLELTNAHYQTSLKTLMQGVLNWQSVKAQLLNGRAWLDAQKLDLKRTSKVLLHVEGLELQELFKVYPAEGLAGTGIIDGQIPIRIEHGAVYVEAGQLKARRPGVLQFRSEKIQNLGKNNPAMRIVADALEDFHFNLLSSAVSYEPSGKLLLNIRLEGKNPDVQEGRPVHLNLNLEEDMPALLASIQLSGQVSEIIEKRIRDRLEKR